MRRRCRRPRCPSAPPRHPGTPACTLRRPCRSSRCRCARTSRRRSATTADRVDRGGHRRGDRPRARSRCRGEPHAGGHRVVRVRRGLDHRDRGVGRKGQRSAGNRRELRRAVEGWRERGSVLQRHGSRLRNGILDRGDARLRRAGDGSQHDARERSGGNLREVRRQRIARDETPRTSQRRGTKPSAGQQRVVAVGRGIEQHVIAVLAAHFNCVPRWARTPAGP